MQAMEFGSYTLIGHLAKGGMAEVFRARRSGAEGFSKEVAIKRILPSYSEDDEFVRMFINEARLASELASDNIVQIHDFDHVDGVYYIAMELVEGKDLRRVIREAQNRGERLPVDLAQYIATECLKGLMVAHEKRNKRGEPLDLIHRDVSPHNILLSYAGEVKLTDFGIAKAAIRKHGTSSDVIRGKLTYMSPEQVSGYPLDQRSDLFSLGIVLFELATGRRLYGTSGREGLLLEVAKAEIPDPATLNAAITPALRQMILTLLQKKPEQRYATAREALSGLHAENLTSDRSLELGVLMERLFPKDARTARRSRITLIGDADPTPEEAETSDSSTAPSDSSTAPSDSRPEKGNRLRLVLLGSAVLVMAVVVAVLLVNQITGPSTPSTGTGVRESSREQARPPPQGPSEAKRVMGSAVTMADSSMANESMANESSAGILVLSDPPGAEVVIDGLPTKHRTPTSFGLMPGQHRIGVRFPGGELVEREETILAGKQHKVQLRLPTASPSEQGQRRRRTRRRRREREPHVVTARPPPPRPARQPSLVTFTCTPWAFVHLSGRKLGSTPTGRRLSPGSYTAQFSNTARKQIRRASFRVRGDGKPITIDCRFR